MEELLHVAHQVRQLAVVRGNKNGIAEHVNPIWREELASLYDGGKNIF
jgi:hypothetical protein